MKSVAIITARGGSKRIPHKNIKEFCGRPIIEYSINAAIQSGIFEEVMVSTDDAQIAEVAVKAGAVVPFMRSEGNSGDYAGTDAVIMEVLNEYEKIGKTFDAFCCIYPTAPFVTAQKLMAARDMLLDDADSVMVVTPFSYPPLRGIVADETGYIKLKWPEYQNTRSQDLPVIYHDCGQFYFCKTQAFYEYKTTDVPRMKPMIVSELEVQDIDNMDDFKMAEIKYRLMLEKDK